MMMKTATALFKENFTDNASRDKRSHVYERGVLAALHLMCDGLKEVMPWKMGSVEADAYLSGHDEGKLIFKTEKDRENGKGR